MAGAVTEARLEALRVCVARVRSRCPPTVPELAADMDLQDIVAVNLVRAIQLCVDMAAVRLATATGPAPASMGEAFSRLAEAGDLAPDLADRLRRAVGFRNVAVQRYRDVDRALVHAVCTSRLQDFEDYARAAAAWR